MAKKTEPPSLSAPSDPTATPVGSGSTLNTPEGGHSECGSMHISATELSYVGSNHWAAIADSIADLRDYVDRGDHLRPVDNHEDASGGRDYDRQTPKRSSRALLLYGCQPVSHAEMLAAMPPRMTVDRYVSRYFNRMDLVSSCECLPACRYGGFASQLLTLTHLATTSRPWSNFPTRSKLGPSRWLLVWRVVGCSSRLTLD